MFCESIILHIYIYKSYVHSVYVVRLCSYVLYVCEGESESETVGENERTNLNLGHVTICRATVTNAHRRQCVASVSSLVCVRVVLLSVEVIDACDHEVLLCIRSVRSRVCASRC